MNHAQDSTASAASSSGSARHSLIVATTLEALQSGIGAADIQGYGSDHRRCGPPNRLQVRDHPRRPRHRLRNPRPRPPVTGSPPRPAPPWAYVTEDASPPAATGPPQTPKPTTAKAGKDSGKSNKNFELCLHLSSPPRPRRRLDLQNHRQTNPALPPTPTADPSASPNARAFSNQTSTNDSNPDPPLTSKHPAGHDAGRASQPTTSAIGFHCSGVYVTLQFRPLRLAL